MAKSSKITVSARVNDVLKLIVAGAEFFDLERYSRENGWNVSPRQLQRYIKRAYKRLAKAARGDQQQLRGRHLLQRRTLYARALKNGDLRTALHILRDEADLLGLYPPTRIAPTTPDGKPLTFEQRRQHIDAILLEKFGIAFTTEDRSASDDPTAGTQDSGESIGQ